MRIAVFCQYASVGRFFLIGYQGSMLPGNITKLKSSTVKLVVFLQGNGGANANATLSVKVNFA